jgi:hypothetical protein
MSIPWPSATRSTDAAVAQRATDLVCASGIAVMFGAFEDGSAPKFIATLPEIAWEASLGIYLIVKGFRPSAILSGDAGHMRVYEGHQTPAAAAQ